MSCVRIACAAVVACLVSTSVAAPTASTEARAGVKKAASNDTRLMFDISLLSNVVNGRRGTRQSLSNQALTLMEENNALGIINEEYGTNLELVWGPAFKMTDEPDIPQSDNLLLGLALTLSGEATKYRGSNATYMNAMMVTQDKETATYYVGIAGTNTPLSIWVLENFNVDTFVPWPYANPKQRSGNGTEMRDTPALFEGFDLAFTFLRSMKPSKGLPGAGKTLLEFLKADMANKAKSTVRVSGQSLGGIMTPVIALYLQDNVETELGLPEGTTITANAFAASTPGNIAFAKYYGRHEALAKRTVVTDNRLDIIPYAWATETLNQIPKLYEEILPNATECVQPLIDFLEANILSDETRGQGAHINPNDDDPFELGFHEMDSNRRRRQGLGTIVETGLGLIFNGDKEKQERCKDIAQTFLKQSAWQHLAAYARYLLPALGKIPSADAIIDP